MKKRTYITGVLLWISLCLLLGGCTGGCVKQKNEGESGPASVTAPGASGISDTGSAQEETSSAARKLQRLYQKDEENADAYELPLSYDSKETVIRLIQRDNHLLVISRGEKARAVLFDLARGKTLARRSFALPEDETVDGGLTRDGGVWLYFPVHGTLRYLDEKLEDVKSESLPPTEENSWSCDGEEGKIWLIDYEDWELQVYDVASSRKQRMKFETLFGRKLNKTDGWCQLWSTVRGKAYVTYAVSGSNSRSCYEIDPEAKKAVDDELLATSSMNYMTDGGVYRVEDKCRVVRYEEPEKLVTVQPFVSDESVIGYESGILFSERKGALYLYDLGKQEEYRGYRFQKEDSPEEYAYISIFSVAEDGNRTIFCVESEEKKQLVLYDLSSVETVKEISVKTESLKELRADVESLREEIEKTGLDFLTDEEAKENPDHSGYQLELYDCLPDHLDACEIMKGFLDQLPDGLMQEMIIGNGGRVELYFCGAITGDVDNGNLVSAGAYVAYEYDFEKEERSSRMVIDVAAKAVLETNVAHEFFHLLEQRFDDIEENVCNLDEQDVPRVYLAQKKAQNKAAVSVIRFWAQQWENFSPESSYLYDYDETSCYDEDGNADYVYDGFNDPDQVYFIDTYSRTYPTEDRARIFENLYTGGETGQMLECFQAPALMKKSVYLCELLRSVYPSLDGEMRNTWEKGLPQKQWEQIRKNREARHLRSGTG